MQATKNSTSIQNPSPEYTRRSPDGGLELVRTGNGIETTAPVQITTKLENNRIVAGLEPRPIIWTLPNGQVRLLEVLQ